MRGDVRHAVRQLISAPGFTLVATLTLALGIGVNSAIFSLADAALMRPLPFGQTERLVMLWETVATSRRGGVSPLNMRDWSLQSQSLSADVRQRARRDPAHGDRCRCRAGLERQPRQPRRRL